MSLIAALNKSSSAMEDLKSQNGALMVTSAPQGTTKTATGSGNIATTLAPGVAFQLREVRLHLSGAGAANNLTITMDAGAGAAYDSVIFTQDMTLVTDLLWQPEIPLVFSATDELDFAWTNGSSRTYGLEIVYELV